VAPFSESSEAFTITMYRIVVLPVARAGSGTGRRDRCRTHPPLRRTADARIDTDDELFSPPVRAGAGRRREP
jgi:hypothetical protein